MNQTGEAEKTGGQLPPRARTIAPTHAAGSLRCRVRSLCHQHSLKFENIALFSVSLMEKSRSMD